MQEVLIEAIAKKGAHLNHRLAMRMSKLCKDSIKVNPRRLGQILQNLADSSCRNVIPKVLYAQWRKVSPILL